MKKRIFWSAVVMGALLLLGLFSSDIYWRAVGVFRGESFYAGRPTSYWREVALSQRENDALRPIVIPPALLAGAPAPAKTWGEKFDEWKQKWRPKTADLWRGLDTNADAIPVLRELIRDVNTRRVALRALAKHGKLVNSDLPTFLDYLRDGPDKNTKWEIARSLHKIGGVELLPILCEWHNDDRLAAMAGDAIYHYGDDAKAAIPELIRQLSHVNGSNAAMTLSRFGEHVIPLLVEVLKSENPNARRNATVAIAWMHGREQLPLLINQLKDADPQVRCIVIKRLGDPLTNIEAIQAVFRTYNDDLDPDVQAAVLKCFEGPILNAKRKTPFDCADNIRSWIDYAISGKHAELQLEAERALEKCLRAK